MLMVLISEAHYFQARISLSGNMSLHLSSKARLFSWYTRLGVSM
jgi:hypothetical protein